MVRGPTLLVDLVPKAVAPNMSQAKERLSSSSTADLSIEDLKARQCTLSALLGVLPGFLRLVVGGHLVL